MLRLDPIEAVYAFVERAYVRLQAEEMLIRCLEEDNSAALQHWVEGLLLAGPQSLVAIREILAEVGDRKAQAMKTMWQISRDFEGRLEGFGFQFGGLRKSTWLAEVTPGKFSAMLEEQGVLDEQARQDCLLHLDEAREQLTNTFTHLGLLDEIQGYLEDWLWGLVYQSAHQEQAEAFRTLQA